MSESQGEVVPALPLNKRRKTLGYLIPLINMPLFALNSVRLYQELAAGTPLGSLGLLNYILLLGMPLLLGVYLPLRTPVYPSSYRLGGEGFTIKRQLRGGVTIPYASIERADVYVRRGRDIPKEALKESKESIDQLGKSGFKFSDYTNSEENIVLLFSGERVYMVSPEKPKNLVRSLKRRNQSLSVKVVELTPRGMRVRESSR